MYTVHGIDNIGIPCTMYGVVFPLSMQLTLPRCTLYMVLTILGYHVPWMVLSSLSPCSSLFLKVQNQGGDILLLHSNWMKREYMLQHLGDAQQTLSPAGQQMMIPSWLTLLSWSLVSRTVQCTQCFWQRIGKKGSWGGGRSKQLLDPSYWKSLSKGGILDNIYL